MLEELRLRGLTLTDLDRQGRDLFIQWCKDAGCTVKIDQMGNIFARRAGRVPSGTRLLLLGTSAGVSFGGMAIEV